VKFFVDVNGNRENPFFQKKLHPLTVLDTWRTWPMGEAMEGRRDVAGRKGAVCEDVDALPRHELFLLVWLFDVLHVPIKRGTCYTCGAGPREAV
jgi:hypothetical protein